ncbi:VOC family protein [Sphingomonas psychrolutea]|uniref:Glyoxalase n=1 Tax=Sphingomonas psychrolutea TaxID=1259676 RepID=A0ABQ1H1B5_9SPHN|nr:VOC family protein [Sphingomonas psychrolutea]GGA54422.1 glyoxalase [Sphingomonas psychrolutea]
MAVAVVSIPVRDQVAGRTFYTEVIGLAVLRDEAMGPDMRWIQLQPKDGGATIALVTWFQGMPPGGVQGLMLGVDNADAEYARLSALGITVSPVDEQPWGRFTMLNDPDGNGLILAQLTAPEEFRTR